MVVQWLHCVEQFLVDIDGKYKDPLIFHPLPWLHVHVYSQSSLFPTLQSCSFRPWSIETKQFIPAQESVYNFLFLKPFFHLHRVKRIFLLPPSLRDTSDLGYFIVTTREGNGTPLQHSCLEKSHGWRSLVGCSPWGR